ncbi:hypothetical protein [Prochlorococcus sp. MIT 1201]|uniref:hypothetical protein n=1 Tax=Prochlorococcus sp. MIT 1201 TaxID=3082535 RepID=UPI0039A62C53
MNHPQSAKDWIQKQYRKSQAYLPEHTFSQKSGCQAHITRACKAHQPNSLHINKIEWQYLAISRRDIPMEVASTNQPLQKFYASYVAFIMPNK